MLHLVETYSHLALSSWCIFVWLFTVEYWVGLPIVGDIIGFITIEFWVVTYSNFLWSYDFLTLIQSPWPELCYYSSMVIPSSCSRLFYLIFFFLFFLFTLSPVTIIHRWITLQMWYQRCLDLYVHNFKFMDMLGISHVPHHIYMPDRVKRRQFLLFQLAGHFSYFFKIS